MGDGIFPRFNLEIGRMWGVLPKTTLRGEAAAFPGLLKTGFKTGRGAVGRYALNRGRMTGARMLVG